METTRAAVVRSFGAPGPGQILAQVHASGVCHTDLHAGQGDWPIKPRLPSVPGHKAVCRVASLGAGVRDFAIGDPVEVLWWHGARGCCEHRGTGWEKLGERQHHTGYGRMAAMPISSRRGRRGARDGHDRRQGGPHLVKTSTLNRHSANFRAVPAERHLERRTASYDSTASHAPNRAAQAASRRR